MGDLRTTLDSLTKCHVDIRKELANVDSSVFKQFFGEFYSDKLLQDLKTYGDGHILYSLPKNVDELNPVSGVVLIAVTSPKLSSDSDFNPTTPLHTIPYWRNDKRLSQTVRSKQSGREYLLHFMAWQQNFAIHGKDDAHARRNYKLLVGKNSNLSGLFQREEELSIKFVKDCKEWLDNNGKPMVLITHYSRTKFDEPISTLMSASNTIHIEANLRGRNYRIMEQISNRLP